MDALIGQLVDGRYKVLEAMASGSMGAVYKAEREPVGKLVAIKFLHASFAKDAEFLTRFERETRVMSKLAHPNCVSVVDFGVWEDAPYLVMEYVSGTTLRALLDDGRLPPQRALALAKQIVAGLAHAHSHGITHRDVKPANIMITDEIGTGDHVRILDFGLARLRGNVGRDATQANTVVGTPNYMAPEQTIGGGTIDARTDIYAVGVVLFEMIAGVRPFAAEDTHQLLGMHRAAPVPKLAAKMDDSSAVPVGAQELIEKAMAKSPEARFPTAIAMSEAIEEVLAGRAKATDPVIVAASKPPRARTDPAAVAPTMVDLASGGVEAPAPRRGVLGSVVFVLFLAGAAGAVIWYFKLRETETTQRVAAGNALVVPPPAVDAALTSPPPPPPPPAVDAALFAAVEGTIVPPTDAGAAPDGAGDDPDTDEIEMDPLAATNPDPKADEDTAEDEAADAPETTEDADKRAPTAPVLAKSVKAAVQMIKDGKRDLALASLRALWKQAPNSAYIPFLLGNLYNDRLWWSVSMDHYKLAIAKNAAYRGNKVLNTNVIKMLGSPKTARKAELFLRGVIGSRYAKGYLAAAARSDKHPNVRKAAGRLAKTIR